MAQLSMSEREVFSKMHFAGASPAEIGRALGRHRCTVSRELAHNGEGADYSAVTAQQKTDVRRRERPLVRKMERQHLSDYVREHLVQRWSPDQIAGRLRREHPETVPGEFVLRQSIAGSTYSRSKIAVTGNSSSAGKAAANLARSAADACPRSFRSPHARPSSIAATATATGRGTRSSARSHQGGVVRLVERKSG